MIEKDIINIIFKKDFTSSHFFEDTLFHISEIYNFNYEIESFDYRKEDRAIKCESDFSNKFSMVYRINDPYDIYIIGSDKTKIVEDLFRIFKKKVIKSEI